MSTSDDQAVAVGHSVEPSGWAVEADRLLDRMAGRFPRVETRRRVGKFVMGKGVPPAVVKGWNTSVALAKAVPFQ